MMKRSILFLLLSLGIGVMAAPTILAAPNTFSVTGSLTKARYGHQTGQLFDGKALVAGGIDSSGVETATAELYNRATGTWTATGNMLTARRAFTMTRLNDGKMLVAGGVNSSGILNKAEVYDPATGTWSATGNLLTARSSHTANLLANGKVLVAGGPTGLFVNAELYDPATGTWSATGSLDTARSRHTSTRLINGRIMVAGGIDGSGNPLASVEIYNPATGSWAYTGSLGTARYNHGANALSFLGKAMVHGGGNSSFLPIASAEVYDLGTGTWSYTGSLGTERFVHATVDTEDGTALAIGGSSLTVGALTSAERYDPNTGTWSYTGSMATGRQVPTATQLFGGKILVAGGFAGGGALPNVEIFDSSAELQNISTRVRVLTGDNVLIGGFIITGTDPKKVILRGLGPSVPVSGALPDPTLELHKPDGSVITNDDWKATQKAEIEATGIPPPNDLESAIVATLAPGSYTAILQGKGTTGAGLVEVYDLAQSAQSRLANISTRGFVDTGDNIMIGGFIIGPGNALSMRVLVRAIGPSLPLSGALQDPTLELRDNTGGLIAFNNDWQDTQKTQIQLTGIPPSDSRESAILMTLPPGNYTAIVRGKTSTTGIALVEAYNLP